MSSASRDKSAKSRAGCEQCKKRKLKCDRRQPTCSRCLARRETCTGNVACDQWQIERPWAIHNRAPPVPSALENDTLRYWYDKACLNMAMFHPPVNPLSYDLSAWLRRSNALRHTLESIAEAHRQGFAPGQLVGALQARELAIVSLHGELDRVRATPSPRREPLLRVMLLSSLLLCISSSWLDSANKDFGLGFLVGSNSLVELLTQAHPPDPPDPLAFYDIGLFFYWHAFSSYLTSPSQAVHIAPSALQALRRPPFDAAVHPVTGISTSLCPLIAEAGQYYRRVVDTGILDREHVRSLEDELRVWTPPDACPRHSQLLQLAEGHRSLALIMLMQAATAAGEDVDRSVLVEHVTRAVAVVSHIPDHDPLLNWVGPVLVIAGSELDAHHIEERLVVERVAMRLAGWTRVPTHLRSLTLVQDVWRLRDSGSPCTWLELMVAQDVALALG
ncbi:fungal-specific transcription factor domain-containing protein [Plectosphaerella cucumerina]|uniref:Fungal-specific transcription factor domain-containing protein n=1 Tax=Plectosphaerella cucumerina TaxID=40658 RepID=A0A8K0WYS3_9PEZI|nr:fungal-specific transcription factor domain-containing protein [Plectosphaerella cucumerina]